MEGTNKHCEMSGYVGWGAGARKASLTIQEPHGPLHTFSSKGTATPKVIIYIDLFLIKSQ